MRFRVAKKVAKRHHEGASYRQTTLNNASKKLKLAERLLKHIRVEEAVTKVKETPQAKQAGPDYTSMSVADLKAAAKEQGLKGYSKMKKAELIDLLQS